MDFFIVILQECDIYDGDPSREWPSEEQVKDAGEFQWTKIWSERKYTVR